MKKKEGEKRGKKERSKKGKFHSAMFQKKDLELRIQEKSTEFPHTSSKACSTVKTRSWALGLSVSHCPLSRIFPLYPSRCSSTTAASIASSWDLGAGKRSLDGQLLRLDSPKGSATDSAMKMKRDL